MKFNKSVLSVIFAFIVLLLIFVYIIRSNTGSVSFPSFSSLLRMLSLAPDISMDFDVLPIVLGDWGVANFLRDFINIFIKLLNLIIWLGNNLLICLEYVFYFLRWLFVG